MRKFFFTLLSFLPLFTHATILAGRTEGSFGVSGTGGATYTIPLQLQAGLSDFVPHLSLTYNSQAGNGLAGFGWNLSGLSSVNIAPRCTYFDGQAECLYRGEDNAYYLDGMRLMLKSGTNGHNGAEYSAEYEQYNKISITASLNDTPATFTVKSTDGGTYKYGSSTGRQYLNSQECYEWALDYAEDRLGNYITYTYAQEGLMLYPTLITYGKNKNGEKGVACTISFTYENRTDGIPLYRFGEKSTFSKRLKSITCKYNGNTYRTYTLAYNVYTYSHLISVTESGTSSSTAYNPTTFTWENLPGWGFTYGACSVQSSGPAAPTFSDQYYAAGDVDNDGITELIGFYSTGGSSPTIECEVRKWNKAQNKFIISGGYSTQNGIGISQMMKNVQHGGAVGHFRSDGNNSIVMPYSTTFDGTSMRFYFPKENMEQNVPLNSSQDPCYSLGDVNRDGKDDIIILQKTVTSGSYPGCVISFGGNVSTSSVANFTMSLAAAPSRILPADFNADGMADLLVCTDSGYYIYWNREGIFNDSDRYASTSFGNCDILEAGDFNGDGLTDLIINKTNSTNWYLAINQGNDDSDYFLMSPVTYLQQEGVKKYHTDDYIYCFVQDIDGDGKSDALIGWGYFMGNSFEQGAICVFQSDGSTLNVKTLSVYNSQNDFPTSSHIVQGDFDGNGVPEIMFYGRPLNATTSGCSWNRITNSALSASTNRIVAVTDGLGARDSIHYDVLTNTALYTTSPCHVYPLMTLHAALPVVSGSSKHITGKAITTGYAYSDGILHLQGKGLLGFSDITSTTSTGLVTTQHSILDSTFNVLLPGSSTVTSPEGGGISRTRNSMLLRAVSGRAKVYETDHSESASDELTTGFYKETNYLNYANGVPGSISTDQDFFWEEQDVQYWDGAASGVYLKGLPSEVTTRKYSNCIDDSEIIEKTAYTRLPANGLVSYQENRRNSQLTSREWNTYNACGQILQHRTAAYNTLDTLTTTYTYNDKGQLTSETDPLGLKTYYYYNAYGMLSGKTVPEGYYISYTYDAMLRQTREHTTVSERNTTRSTSTFAGSAYSIQEEVTGQPQRTAYYDAWDRKVAETETRFDGAVQHRTFIWGDNGELQFESFPFRSGSTTNRGITYQYDYAHRRTIATDSNGKTDTWAYDRDAVNSCVDGVEREVGYYTSGIPWWVDEDGESVEYLYNADRKVAQIEHLSGPVAEYTYDTFGRLTKTKDMNGVVKEYTYDSHGYPLRKSLSGGYEQTTYDKYGILRNKSRYDQEIGTIQTTYTYDSKLRLIREESPQYRRQYSYDTYSRLTSESDMVQDSTLQHSVSATYTYNSSNQLSMKRTKLVPRSNIDTLSRTLTETYAYANGWQTEVRLGARKIWSLLQEDDWGRPTSVKDTLNTVGNTYDDYGHMLSNTVSGHNSLSETYSYHLSTGNLTSKDGRQITYDSMNRLTGWGTQSYSYDNLNNLEGLPTAGTFHNSGFRLRDVSGYNSSGFTLNRSRMSWLHSIERPYELIDSFYSARFDYDGDAQRIRMRMYYNNWGNPYIQYTHCYPSDNTELVCDRNGSYTWNYYAGGDYYTAKAVQRVHMTPSDTLYQIYRDNLGSVVMYANHTGGSYRYYYSPWGTRLAGASSEASCALGQCPAGPFTRTYTGHEELWQFGLLNANARLYNPYIGRFISPDPLLNSEGGPLDFNPYVYARNNPYRYIDRDGEWFLLALALAGGIYNVVDNRLNIHNFGDAFSFFAVGAAAGVASGVLVAAVPVAIGGFAGGAILGSIGGAVNGFILGGGNSLVLGNNFWGGAFSGLWQGALYGAAYGGIIGGLQAKMYETNFWNGKQNIVTPRHRPTMTEPDAMPNQARAENSFLHSEEYLATQETNASWEIYYKEQAPNIVSTDGISTKITRPEIKGYDLQLKFKTDPNHIFPKEIDNYVVKYGMSHTFDNSTGYILPGRYNGNPGYYHININNQTGIVYHRNFYPFDKRFQMYVGPRNGGVYFFAK